MRESNVCRNPNCRHINPEGWKYCNQCGKPKNAPVAGKPFPTVLKLHPEADLTVLARDIFPQSTAFALDPVEFAQVFADVLNDNMQQVLIRVYQLHKSGRHEKISIEAVSAERESNKHSTSSTLGSAFRRLRGPFLKAMQEAERQASSEDTSKLEA